MTTTVLGASTGNDIDATRRGDPILFTFVVLRHESVPRAMALRCPVSYTRPLGQIQNSSGTFDNHEVLGEDVDAEYAIDLGEQPFAPFRVRFR